MNKCLKEYIIFTNKWLVPFKILVDEYNLETL
jgi:hypothetical protein